MSKPKWKILVVGTRVIGVGASKPSNETRGKIKETHGEGKTFRCTVEFEEVRVISPTCNLDVVIFLDVVLCRTYLFWVFIGIFVCACRLREESRTSSVGICGHIQPLNQSTFWRLNKPFKIYAAGAFLDSLYFLCVSRQLLNIMYISKYHKRSKWYCSICPLRPLKHKGTSELFPLTFCSYEFGHDCFTQLLNESHFTQNLTPSI